MCGLSTVVTPAGASLTMYREIRSYANSIWDDNNNNNSMRHTSRTLRSQLAALERQFQVPFDPRITHLLIVLLFNDNVLP